MSEIYSLNEKTFIYRVIHVGGRGCVSQTMAQYDRGLDGGPEEAKIV